MENIRQFAVEDAENQTAYLKLPPTIRGGTVRHEIEADAYYLKLLSRTNPRDTKAPAW